MKRYTTTRFAWGVWPVTKYRRDRWNQRRTPWGSASSFEVTLLGLVRIHRFKLEGDEFEFPLYVRVPQRIQSWLFDKSYCTQSLRIAGFRVTLEAAMTMKPRWVGRLLLKAGGWERCW